MQPVHLLEHEERLIVLLVLLVLEQAQVDVHVVHAMCRAVQPEEMHRGEQSCTRALQALLLLHLVNHVARPRFVIP